MYNTEEKRARPHSEIPYNTENRRIHMKAMQIGEGVYWVGAIDWNLRNFHG